MSEAVELAKLETVWTGCISLEDTCSAAVPDILAPTSELTKEAHPMSITVTSSATSATHGPSGSRCVVSTLVAIALTLSAVIPTVSRSPGPLTNSTMSSVSASLTGSAADDVTAASENR